MAFEGKKIYPIDLNPGKAVGIGLPFNAPAVFKSTYTTKDAIRTNLINYFLTNKGERYLNPTFGGNVRAFIFEQITSGNLDFLKEDIQSQLTLFFPNVKVEKLEVLGTPDTNEVSITLSYSIINTGITDQLQLLL